MFYESAKKVEKRAVGLKDAESAKIRELEKAEENQIENDEEEEALLANDDDISYPNKPYTEKFLRMEQDEISDSVARVREKNQK